MPSYLSVFQSGDNASSTSRVMSGSSEKRDDVGVRPASTARLWSPDAP